MPPPNSHMHVYTWQTAWINSYSVYGKREWEVWEGWRASGVWACRRETSCSMCERQNCFGLSLGNARFGFIADTHRKHSSAQSPSGDIGCSFSVGLYMLRKSLDCVKLPHPHTMVLFGWHNKWWSSCFTEISKLNVWQCRRNAVHYLSSGDRLIYIGFVSSIDPYISKLDYITVGSLAYFKTKWQLSPSLLFFIVAKVLLSCSSSESCLSVNNIM